MADGRAAYDPDRLPWLTEDRKPRRAGDSTALLLWALVATLLVAGVSYWMGMKSAGGPMGVAESPVARPPAATIRLPEPAVELPRAEPVKPPPVPEVEPVAEPAPVPIPRLEPKPAAKRVAKAKPAAPTRKATARKASVRKATVRKKTAARKPARLQAWPAEVSQGAHGRMVRIGTFTSRLQAKRAWSRIVRIYPGMTRLRAVVVPSPSMRNGRTFYRLQFGTTSQAHSTVLCQRMRIVGQSCVVVGLPANQGGVRR